MVAALFESAHTMHEIHYGLEDHSILEDSQHKAVELALSHIADIRIGVHDVLEGSTNSI